MDTQSVWLRIRNRVGRRGLCLLVFSLVFIMYGLGFLFDPGTQDRMLNGPYFVLARSVSPMFWGACWVIAALVALPASFSNKPPHINQLAFALLTFMTTVWSAATFAGWIIDGRITSYWTLGFLWGAVALLTILLAGWPEDPRHRRREYP